MTWTISAIAAYPPRDDPAEDRFLALATVHYEPIGFTGVFLVRNADGELAVSFPGQGRRRVFVNRAARAELVGALEGAYRALGGNATEPPLATASSVARAYNEPSTDTFPSRTDSD